MFSFADSAETYECAFPLIKETVPQSALGYQTNNLYPKFPPIMADGRAVVSSWQPESAFNDKLIHSNKIKSNWMYRNYLVKNGRKIMELNFRDTCNDTGFFIPPLEIGASRNSNTGPHTFSSYQDSNKPIGYQDSDLKQMYLSREQLNAKKVAPVMQ